MLECFVRVFVAHVHAPEDRLAHARRQSEGSKGTLKVEVHGLGVTDVQESVRLRGETRADLRHTGYPSV